MQSREVIKIGATEVMFLLEGADTNNELAMFEFTLPAGVRVPLPHSHIRYDETVYGLQGVFTFTVNGVAHDIKAGETLFIPRGAVHGFHNNGEETAKGLAVITPALIGPSFFKETAEIVNAGGPPDVEKLKIVFSKYGLEPVFPGK